MTCKTGRPVFYLDHLIFSGMKYSTNPGNLFGGTWVAWGSGRVPVGVNTSDSDFSSPEKTGGSKTFKSATGRLAPERVLRFASVGAKRVPVTYSDASRLASGIAARKLREANLSCAPSFSRTDRPLSRRCPSKKVPFVENRSVT